MTIDLPRLAARLGELNLLQQSFADMDKAAILALCRAVLESVDTQECPWKYVCDQVPSYKARCKGVEKCARAVEFARLHIPKKGWRQES